tara:strand:+ start:5057 stop:5746 length:690 start_codon:yes stop_codon:yes gene_type:complete
MARYTKGKHAVAIDDRSGFKVKHKDLRREWTGMMVHKSDWESKQAQLDPSKYFKNTGSNVIENPRPDTSNDSVVVRLGPLNQGYSGTMKAYNGTLHTGPGGNIDLVEIPPGQEAGTAQGSPAFNLADQLTGIAAGTGLGTLVQNLADQPSGVAAGTAQGGSGLFFGSTEIPPGIATATALGTVIVNANALPTGIAAGSAQGSVTPVVSGWSQGTWGQGAWGYGQQGGAL